MAFPLTLMTGTNTILVAVTGTGGSTTVYGIFVTVDGGTGTGDSSLSDLVLSDPDTTIAPDFASATTAYSASVAGTVTRLDLTATLADGTSSFTVALNGGIPAAGTSGDPFIVTPLTPGANTIVVTVTAQGGAETVYGVLVIARPIAGSSELDALALSNPDPTTALSPAFTPLTTVYIAGVASGVISIDLTASLIDLAASFTVALNGGPPAAGTSGAPFTLTSLTPGANTILVTVSGTGGSETVYSVFVIVGGGGGSAKSRLSALELSNPIPTTALSPDFAALTTAYSAGVASGVIRIDLTATLADLTSNFTVALNGGTPAAGTSGQAFNVTPLMAGANTILVTVDATDGATTFYSVVVIVGANAAPTIDGDGLGGPIPDQSAVKDVAFGPLAFLLVDENPATAIVTSVTSDDQSIIADSSISVLSSTSPPPGRFIILITAPPVVGVANITVNYEDDQGATGSGTFELVVLPTAGHQRPTADNDFFQFTDGALSLTVLSPGVLVGDNTAATPPLATLLVSDPVDGDLVFGLFPLGGFVYTPPLGGLMAPDSFTYRAVDSAGVPSRIATVTISLTAAGTPTIDGNDPDLQAALADLFYLTTNNIGGTAPAFDNRTLKTIGDAVLAAASDPDDQTLTVLASIDGGATFVDPATLDLAPGDSPFDILFVVQDTDDLFSAPVSLDAFLLDPTADPDGDSFNNGVEVHVGTDPLVACLTPPGTTSDGSIWPVDTDGDQAIGLQDLLNWRDAFLAALFGNLNLRFDLDVSGGLAVGDATIFVDNFGDQRCS